MCSEWGQQHSISIYVFLSLHPRNGHLCGISNLENELSTLISITQTHQTITDLPIASNRSIGSMAIMKITFSSEYPWNGVVYLPFWWNLTTNVINPLSLSNWSPCHSRTTLLFAISIMWKTEAQNDGKLIFFL